MTEAAKRHFFMRLVPPRPTFPFDMSDEERSVMSEHAAYLRKHFDAGRILVYGPVLGDDAFGLGIFEADDEAEVKRIMDADPSVLCGLNTYEIAPMRVTGERGR